MDRKLMTVKEASIKYGMTVHKIHAWIRSGKLDDLGTKIRKIDESQLNDLINGKTIKNHILSPFGDLILDYDEALKPLEAYHNPNSWLKPGKYASKCSVYFVSNKGRVFDFRGGKGKELSKNLAAHDYFQVDIHTINGKKSERVHVLVAFVWCPNSKLKCEIHHINGNIHDNRPENLIWVTSTEHDELHSLMKKDKTAYQKRIEEIKRDNQSDDEYRVILLEKDNGIIYSWIKKEAYNDFLSGERELDEIYFNESLEHGERFIRFE